MKKLVAFILVSSLVGVMNSTPEYEYHPTEGQFKIGLDISTFLGGDNFEEGLSIVIDDSGNIYVTGSTYSANFPMLNSYDNTHDGDTDVFVAAFLPNGTLYWSTFLGAVASEKGNGIAIDGSGNIYVTGWTTSQEFPTLKAFNNTKGNYEDAFVASFSKKGELRWSTFLGGEGMDKAENIAVDIFGNIYVVGQSDSMNFPKANSSAGGIEVFVASFSSNGTLQWSELIGGNANDIGYDLTTDNQGNIYVTGKTLSMDFPTLNAFNNLSNGFNDAFVLSLYPNRTMSWSTYLGGSGSDYGYGIAVDDLGNAVVTGETISIDFPVQNINDTVYKGTGDAFVTSIAVNGTLLWSRYLGGNDWDFAKGIAINNRGNIFVSGTTLSWNFPTRDAFSDQINGVSDAFVTSLLENGTILWSTFFGGTQPEFGLAITVDDQNNTYLIGQTQSADLPTENAYNSTFGGNSDVFVAKFNLTYISHTTTITITKTVTQNYTFTKNYTVTKRETTTQNVATSPSANGTSKASNPTTSNVSLEGWTSLVIAIVLVRKRKH